MLNTQERDEQRPDEVKEKEERVEDAEDSKSQGNEVNIENFKTNLEVSNLRQMKVLL